MTKTPRLWRNPQYGHVYGEEITTPNLRIAWPHLDKPNTPKPMDTGQQSSPRFEVQMLIPKDSKEAAELTELLVNQVTAMVELFNEGRSVKISNVPLFKDGDGPKIDKEKYPYYAKHFIMNCRVSVNAKPYNFISTPSFPDPKSLVGGMVCKAVLQPLLTTHGISFKIVAIRGVIDDGTRFGGSTRDYGEMLGGTVIQISAPDAQVVDSEQADADIAAQPVTATPVEAVAAPVAAPVAAAPVAAAPVAQVTSKNPADVLSVL